MPTISKKQLEEYEQLKKDRDNGRLLTPDGLRFIWEARIFTRLLSAGHIRTMSAATSKTIDRPPALHYSEPKTKR